jgi:hypothetical protein
LQARLQDFAIFAPYMPARADYVVSCGFSNDSVGYFDMVAGFSEQIFSPQEFK